MLETVIVIAVVVVALAAGAVASSYRRFAGVRSRLLAHLSRAAPEITVTALTDTGFRARALGTEIDLDLATLLRQRPRDRAEPGWFDEIVSGMRARVPVPEAPPFALVQDRVLPQLKPADYVAVFEHYPPAQRLVSRPLDGGVAVTYVIGGVHQYTAVTQHTLGAWRQTADTLHALALENLRAQTRHLLEDIGGPRRRYEHLDGLDATRLLVAEMLVPAGVDDPLVAIPEESVLLVAPSGECASLAAEASARFASAARPLSPAVFKPAPTGPVAVPPPV
ncbi:MAG: hypothetical protein QN178_01215 [Armatimonadota bacterium]|nr:hypothetical protein [Armatimonadota bacterium]